jgi:FkbM family methyltransferase
MADTTIPTRQAIDAEALLAQAGMIYKLAWRLLWPARWYLRAIPLPRGKGLILRHLLMPLLPSATKEFEAQVVGGVRVRMRYRERLGLSTLLNGGFENKELEYARSALKPGDTAFDVGANIGLFSVVLAQAVDSSGAVVAFEPVPANASRAEANVTLNGLGNVRVVVTAVGAEDGVVQLNMAEDPAYPSIQCVAENHGNGRCMRVPIARLDTVWRQMGSPSVKCVKIDVEGAELEVLQGATELLVSCRPLLILEANGENALAKLQHALGVVNYRLWQPDGFMVHNYVAEYARATV